ncbi:MAG: nucleotidyltransferase domain-containing protein [Euryarchaeota archaeon]|nr:nucleotidyltransferase domain-containing protein [Euryarchaeota archaeon]
MVRKNERMFEKTNLSPLALKVLAYLSRSPERQHYVREIAGLTHNSVGGCHRVLRELSTTGLIDKEKSGRNLYYRARTRNPAIKYFKVFTTIQELNDVIRTISGKARRIVLFGSCASGEDTVDSDIDLLVITEDAEEIKRSLKNVIVGGRRLAPMVLLPHAFIKLKDRDPAFYDETNRGIVLWRDDYERV